MRLIFSDNDQAPIELAAGTLIVGSDPSCDVVLNGEGVGPKHAKLIVSADSLSVGVEDLSFITRLNGVLVIATTPVANGDVLSFADIRCVFVSDADDKPEPAVEQPASRPRPQAAATVVRPAASKYYLLGKGGVHQGQHLSLASTAVVGRDENCQIQLKSDGASREHAKIMLQAGAVVVQDLGSTNGTFVNDERIDRATVRPGDIIAFDKAKFELKELPSPASSDADPQTEQSPEAASSTGSMRWLIIAAALGAAALIFAFMR